MKKLLLICIIIAGIVFVSGCVGGEKASDTKTLTDTKTPIITRTDQKIEVPPPEMFLKLSDIPSEFKFFDYYYTAIRKSDDCPPCGPNPIRYFKDIPAGYKPSGGYNAYSDGKDRYIIAVHWSSVKPTIHP